MEERGEQADVQQRRNFDSHHNRSVGQAKVTFCRLDCLGGSVVVWFRPVGGGQSARTARADKGRETSDSVNLLD